MIIIVKDNIVVKKPNFFVTKNSCYKITEVTQNINVIRYQRYKKNQC